MNKDDMILISVDDHIVEPPDMFKNHLAKKYLDEAPRLVHNPDGSDTWQFRDVVIPNVALNKLPACECIEGDVFQLLRKLRDRARSFDLIVLDPPKFAPTAAHAEKASRAYKDINLLAFKLLRPGGLLFTFSCSGGVSRELFQKIVAGAALDAGVDAQIVEHLSAGADHPVALNFPEGDYLKGLICRVPG